MRATRLVHEISIVRDEGDDENWSTRVGAEENREMRKVGILPKRAAFRTNNK